MLIVRSHILLSRHLYNEIIEYKINKNTLKYFPAIVEPIVIDENNYFNEKILQNKKYILSNIAIGKYKNYLYLIQLLNELSNIKDIA